MKHNPQGAVGAAVSGGSARAIPGEIWPEDFDAVPFSTADQHAELQAWCDALRNRTDGARYGSIAGTYRVDGQLDISGGAGQPVTIRGVGSNVAGTAPAVIYHLADAGAGQWALKTGNDNHVSGISFVAESTPITVGGTPTWEMWGVKCNAGFKMKNMAVRGYASGAGLAGDHIEISECDLRGNGYGIDVPPGIATQGDILIEKTRLDGSSFACIGVAQNSKLAGVTIRDCPAAQSPYDILRYPVAGMVTYTTPEEVAAHPGSFLLTGWITGLWIEGLASEYLGDGAVVDGVPAGDPGDAGTTFPGISGIKWLKNSGDFGMFNTDRDWEGGSPYPSKIASWLNKGGIADVEVGDGFPSATTTQPSFSGSALADIKARTCTHEFLTGVKDGGLPFKTTGTSGQSIIGCRFGTPGGNGSPVVSAFMLQTGSVARGELLMRFQDLGAQKMTDATQHCIGVVQRAASADGIVLAVTEGTDSEIMVKNTSGSTIANGALVKPHASGGVQLASSMADGAIGRVYSASIVNGALGPCEIFPR